MSDVKKLLKKHGELNQLDNVRVESHVQRGQDEWVINTVLLEGYDVPFKYKRNKPYKSLRGARVNLTFYPDTESIAGMDLEVMNVVRIRRS